MADDEITDDAPLGSPPIAALLRGEPVPDSREPLNSCVETLHSLEQRIEEVKESRGTALSPHIHHVDNLLRNGIEPVLREEVTVVQPDGQLSTFYFGQVLRSYDLQFLRDTVRKVVEDLSARPVAADASLSVLTPYLQT
jgi:hypothetical protein